MKEKFNQKFILFDGQLHYLASAIDAQGRALVAPRSNMGHCLWASLDFQQDGELDSIVEQKFIDSIVKRLMQPDLFEKNAGIRTLSTKSRYFDTNSYHNGSIWPHDNSMIIEGLERYGYLQEAQQVKMTLLKAETRVILVYT